MRGIVMADAIQAVMMIFSLLVVFAIAIVKSGGPTAIYETNLQYDRLKLFNFTFDPTIRLTFWSIVCGWNFLIICFIGTNQALLQRCVMAPNIKMAFKISMIGSTMAFVVQLIYQLMGIVVFAYYSGCNVVKEGLVTSINQMFPYFAMEILYPYRTLPGIFFTGIICTTLSTISSLLNSSVALIVGHLVNNRTRISAVPITVFCKILVVVVGVVMFSALFIVDRFPNFNQAAVTLTSAINAPTFAIYLIGIFCPSSNSKCVAISYLLSLLFGLYLTVGYAVSSPFDPPEQFANCSAMFNNQTFLNISTTQATETSNYLQTYFPLSKLSYLFIPSQVFILTVTIFVILTIFNKTLSKHCDRSPIDFDKHRLDLIPPLIRRLHLKMSRCWRRYLLCDIYDCDLSVIDSEIKPLNQ
ncbi:hypothetical protein CHUAL_002876 [Chamberlinius hualienensis]